MVDRVKGVEKVTDKDVYKRQVEEGKKSTLNCKAVAFWKTAADTVNVV